MIPDDSRIWYDQNTSVHSISMFVYNPPTPAASRGSASEEALLATRGEKRKLDKHGLRPATGFLDRADGRKRQGLKLLVSRQFRKRRLAVWAAGRGPDPSFTAMVFEACDRVLGPELTAGKSKV